MFKPFTKVSNKPTYVYQTALLLGFFSFLALNSPLGQASDQKVDPAVSKAVLAAATESLKLAPLNNDAFEKVFQAKLYKAEIGFNQGGSVFGTFVGSEGKLMPLRNEQGGRHIDFADLLRRDFRVTSEQSILDLREALLATEEGAKPDADLPLFGVYKRNWTVITGTFFDDYSGYIIQIGPIAGKISKIEYVLKIPKKSLTKQ